MTYTQNRSKKLLNNKNMCTIYIFFYSNSSLSLLQFPISAMPLPKIKQFFFFLLLFQQCHCHKFIPTIFVPSISAMPLPQTNCNKFFFPSYFSNAIATNSFPQFLFFSISTMPLPQIHSHKIFSSSILAMPLPKINCHFFFFFGEMTCSYHFYNKFQMTSYYWLLLLD